MTPPKGTRLVFFSDKDICTRIRTHPVNFVLFIFSSPAARRPEKSTSSSSSILPIDATLLALNPPILVPVESQSNGCESVDGAAPSLAVLQIDASSSVNSAIPCRRPRDLANGTAASDENDDDETDESDDDETDDNDFEEEIKRPRANTQADNPPPKPLSQNHHRIPGVQFMKENNIATRTHWSDVEIAEFEKLFKEAKTKKSTPTLQGRYIHFKWPWTEKYPRTQQQFIEKIKYYNRVEKGKELIGKAAKPATKREILAASRRLQSLASSKRKPGRPPGNTKKK